MSDRFDIAIIGAGMAGASLAARLAGRARVILLEAEAVPGYHATGRSAAFWTESYGGPKVQPLTSASGDALRAGGFLKARGALTVARAEQARELNEFAAQFSELGVVVERLAGEELRQRVPGLRSEWCLGAFEPDCCDIDVAALHQFYLAQFRQAGGELRCRAQLAEAQPDPAGWQLCLKDGETIACGTLVNAAGAWADEIAGMAGIESLGIKPFRRTIAQLAVAPMPLATMPLVLDLAEQFYFKPEAGRLWLSPHDETPCLPGDAAPEELDVALAIDRLAQVTNWTVDRVERRWAGLRSFAPDRLPVYGFDPGNARFFWCAGQGGFGIQTAPAASDLAARLLLGEPAGAVAPEPYLPDRFRRA